MGKTWQTHFSYKILTKINEERWVTTLEGNIVAKDGNDALKKIRKQLRNKIFEKLVIEAGNRVNV